MVIYFAPIDLWPELTNFICAPIARDAHTLWRPRAKFDQLECARVRASERGARSRVERRPHCSPSVCPFVCPSVCPSVRPSVCGGRRNSSLLVRAKVGQ